MFATMVMFFAFGFVMSLFNRSVSSPQVTFKQHSESTRHFRRDSHARFSPHNNPDWVFISSYSQRKEKRPETAKKPDIEYFEEIEQIKKQERYNLFKTAAHVLKRAEVRSNYILPEEQREVTDAQ